MAQFENQVTKLPKDQEGKEKLGFADLLLMCLDKVPPQGVTYSEMASSLDLVSKLKKLKPKGLIEIPSEQLPGVKEKVESMRWNKIDEELIAFSKYVVSLN